ncbi:MAG TPA: DUF1576 domain-containing protein, partial [Erysipelothrix sp.]|nr:DUF1576 domain-containing protein [Erysipelothrix sp.]
MKVKQFLVGFNIFLIILGFIYEPSISIFTNMVPLIMGSDTLITDYFIKGSVGSAFLNAGLVGLIAIYLLNRYVTEDTIRAFPAVMLMTGFAFFGKNILNIWPIIIGTYIYSKHKKISFGSVLPTAFFATSFAPLISELLFASSGNLVVRILLSWALGISVGFIIVFFSNHMFRIHKGYNLYNVGFSIGILSTLYVSLLRSFGLDIQTHLMWDDTMHISMFMVFYFLFIGLIIYGVLSDNTSLQKYRKLLKTTGHQARYIDEFGFETVSINMGVNGIISLSYLILIGAPLNGATLGGVLTVVGFASNGKHLFNIVPIFIGIMLGGITKTWSTNLPSMVLGALFGTGLAPLVGRFGIIPGIIASYVMSSVVLNTGFLHESLNLYNTGFAIGLVCAFLVPL